MQATNLVHKLAGNLVSELNSIAMLTELFNCFFVLGNHNWPRLHAVSNTGRLLLLNNDKRVGEEEPHVYSLTELSNYPKVLLIISAGRIFLKSLNDNY